MTPKEAAAALNNSQYREEGTRELFDAMKTDGLVAVFGASDDLMEFRGAIYDEIGAYDGTTAHLTPDGLLTNDCDNEDCPHFAKAKENAATIEAVWSPDGDSHSWIFRTAISHETFEVLEDAEPYCRGIVFALADAS